MVRSLRGRPAEGPARATGSGWTLAVAAGVAAWLAAFGGAALLLGGLAGRGTAPVGGLVLLCGMGPAAWLRRIRRLRVRVPGMRVPRLRLLGDLRTTGAEEHRQLRSIGLTRSDVVGRTDALLCPLVTLPSVQIFRGVRLDGAAGGETLAAHAVCAGRQVWLVESVAWPAGVYTVAADRQVRCDGRAIGQSTAVLSRAVGAVAKALPRSHRVRGVVVVHRTDEGVYRLPAPSGGIVWVLAESVTDWLAGAVNRRGRGVSRHIVGALSPDSGSAPGRRAGRGGAPGVGEGGTTPTGRRPARPEPAERPGRNTVWWGRAA